MSSDLVMGSGRPDGGRDPLMESCGAAVGVVAVWQERGLCSHALEAVHKGQWSECPPACRKREGGRGLLYCTVKL